MTGEVELFSPGALTGKAATAFAVVAGGGEVDPDVQRSHKAARYARARLTEETRRKYLHWIKRYLYFCSVHGRRELPRSAEAAAATLEAFMIWLAELEPTRGKNAGRGAVGMSPSAMRQALAGVRSFYKAAGILRAFDNSLALDIIDAHESERSDPGAGFSDGQGSRPVKLPTLLELIRACPVEGPHRVAGIRDRAILSMGYVIMARRSELCSLDHEHITEDQGDLRVFVPKTKTSRNGRTAYLPPWADYPDCSPVATVQAWQAVSRDLGITTGPLFRGVDSHGNVAGIPGGPFAGPPGSDGRLDGEAIEYAIARAAANALLAGGDLGGMKPSELKPHGVLRAGGATAAYEANADILAIRRQGGWADTSPVVFRYIREVDLRVRNPMRRLGNSAS